VSRDSSATFPCPGRSEGYAPGDGFIYLILSTRAHRKRTGVVQKARMLANFEFNHLIDLTIIRSLPITLTLEEFVSTWEELVEARHK
jgi:hypothetical protein